MTVTFNVWSRSIWGAVIHSLKNSNTEGEDEEEEEKEKVDDDDDDDDGDDDEEKDAFARNPKWTET